MRKLVVRAGNATDLINPKSAITGTTPILKETKHWFLPLDKHESFSKRMDSQRT